MAQRGVAPIIAIIAIVAFILAAGAASVWVGRKQQGAVAPPAEDVRGTGEHTLMSTTSPRASPPSVEREPTPAAPPPSSRQSSLPQPLPAPPPPATGRLSAAMQRLADRLRQVGIPCTPATLNEYEIGTSFLIDPSDSNTLYVSVRYHGIFKTTDGGATWQKITGGIFAYPDQSNLGRPCHQGVGDAVIDPKNPRRILIAWLDINNGTIYEPYSESAGLWETRDGGKTWHTILKDWMNAGPGGALALDPVDPETVYFGVDNTPSSYREADPQRYINTTGAIYKTTDGGNTWAELPTGLLDGLHGLAVFVNPKRPQELILFTNTHRHIYTEQGAIEVPSEEHLGPVLASDDSGQNWRATGTVPTGYELLVEGDVSPRQFSHLFIIPFILNNPEGQQSFYSIDGGKTFRPSGLYLQVARYDPFDESGSRLLGVTTYGPPSLLESRDAGATWQPLGDLPAEARAQHLTITNIVWDLKDQRVIYLTGGGGYVWRSSDGGGSWQVVMSLEKIR